MATRMYVDAALPMLARTTLVVLKWLLSWISFKMENIFSPVSFSYSPVD